MNQFNKIMVLGIVALSSQAMYAGFQNGRQIPDKVSILNDTGETVYAISPSFNTKNGQLKDPQEKVTIAPNRILSFENELSRGAAPDNYKEDKKQPPLFVFIHDQLGKIIGTVLFPGYDPEGPVIHYQSSVWAIRLSELKKKQKMDYFDYFTVEKYSQQSIINLDAKPLFYDYFATKLGEPYKKAIEEQRKALYSGLGYGIPKAKL